MIGGLGIQELLIVLIVALFLFGGKKLPEVGRNLGKAIRGFKEGTEEGAGEPEAL
ncbi:MAG: twin-arginine translocase TatA/TatE family subunit, partial [bacterium]